MTAIMDKLRTRPLVTALVLLAVYFLIFALPSLTAANSFGRGKGLETATDVNSQLPFETALLLSILVIIAVLRWWRACHMITPLHKGGLKFALPPLLFTLLLLLLAVFLQDAGGIPIVIEFDRGLILTLLLTTLFVGLFEEFLFRGCVFHGFDSAYGPVIAVLASSVLFGAMHYVNWIAGQDFAQTTSQVFHAAGGGVLYAALMLRTGSIWVPVILHGLWDTAVTLVATASSQLPQGEIEDTPEAVPDDGGLIGAVASFGFQSFELLYGLFVLWMWWRWQKRNKRANVSG